MGRPEEGQRLLRLAEGAAARAGGGDDLEAFRLRRLGIVLSAAGKPAEAVPVLRRALELRRRASGVDARPVGEALSSLGHALMLTGRYEEALSVHRESVALLDKTYGLDYPFAGVPLLHIGYTLRLLGRRAEALPPLSRALALRRGGFPPGSPLILEAVLYVGETLLSLGRAGEAAALMEPELALRAGAPDPYGDIPTLEGDLGVAYARLGQRDRGLALVKAAIAHQHALGKEPYRAGMIEVSLAKLEWDDPKTRADARRHMLEARDLVKQAPEGEAVEEKAEVDPWLDGHR
jgi:tetratricopeptide (TPR) repeat protein